MPTPLIGNIGANWLRGAIPSFPSASSPGVAEVTRVECVADSGGSLHDKHFRIWNASGQVAVVLDGGERPPTVSAKQKTSFDFSGLTFADFITANTGKHLWVYGATSIFCTWFNFGTESAPDDGGVTLLEVNVSPLGNLTSIATGLKNALVGTGEFTDQGSSDAVCIVEDTDTGPRGDAQDVGAVGCAITILTRGENDYSGRPATGPVTGVTSIIVPIADNMGDSSIAAAIAAACDGQGWAVSLSTNSANFTDAAAGARTHAFDVNTGFNITVNTAGVDPS